MSFKPQFSDAGTGEAMGATGPQYFADQLTLFRPGEDKLSPNFFTFRHHWFCAAIQGRGSIV